LAEDLMSGRLDLAYLCETAIPPAKAVVEWKEPLHWIGATGLTPASDAPIPLVTWYGTLTDRLGIKALEATGRRFSIEFSSPDISSRHAAVRAGLGYTLSNARLISPGLSIVAEPLLPATRDMPSGVYMRAGLDRERFEPIIQAFVKAIEPPHIRAQATDEDSFDRRPDRRRAS
jgi:DNA-binding transcriptional LysR family regulator